MAKTEKLALKGLKGVAVFSITTNTETEYDVGTRIPVPSAQSLTKSDEKEEYEIFADDTTYDAGADYKYTTLELTTAELATELEATLAGGDFEETDGVYSVKSTDVAPEFALVYASLMASGGHRMFKHPVVKLMSVKVDHATKGNTNDIASYTLTFRSMARKIDQVYREQKDVAKGEPLTWLDTIESLPKAGG